MNREPGLTGRERTLVPIGELVPNPKNPRKHNFVQIDAIARSIRAFGFNAPILVDKNMRIVAGHGRYLAAKRLSLERVPVVCLGHLTEAQAKAYMLADNKLTERSQWDEPELALHLKDLSDLALDFEIEATGFELPEIDFLIQSLDLEEVVDDADAIAPTAELAVSRPGDLWLLGEHRLNCGNALEAQTYEVLMGTERAAAVFADPPYNVKIDGHVCGAGAIKHREFAMAAGEMDETAFEIFLTNWLQHTSSFSTAGAVMYACMDWRHMTEILAAGRASGLELLNLCVWVKYNGGMGSFYRSRHELVFVFRNGQTPHVNNIQLGKYGRNRTNVWNYPGANAFGRKGKANALTLHPTAKPIALVSDAIIDSTKRNAIVLDPFCGSGTTLLAAERTGRRGYVIELDPLYVDLAIARWEAMTGAQARLADGTVFAEVKAGRRPAP